MTSTASWGTEQGFRRLCGELGVELEDFQARLVREVFAGRRELLVLIPRGNGKTTLFAVLALYHLLVVPNARVYIAAAATDQAKEMYEIIRDFVQDNAKLRQAVEYRPGFREIRYKRRNGMVKVLSSDAPKALGLRPTLVLIDELCAHENDELYENLKTALGKRPEAQLVTITTAGWDEEKVLFRMRQAFRDRDGCHRPKDDPRLLVSRNDAANSVMFEWALEPHDDIANVDVLKSANPASFVTREFLAEELASPGLPKWTLARYHGNVWTPTFESWLPHGAWDACYDPDAEIPDGAEVFCGVDVGQVRDTSSLVLLHRREDGRWVVKAEIWEPRGEELDLKVVEQGVRDAADRFDVRLVVFDPWRFKRSAGLLEEEGLLMVQFDGNNARTVPASLRLYEAINRRELVHDGDRQLKRQIESGVKMDTERGWRIMKSKAKLPTDALYALMIAFSLAEGPQFDGPLLEVVPY